MRRRELLSALLVSATGGCLRLSNEQSVETATPTPSRTTATTTPESTPTTPTAKPEPDYPLGLSSDGPDRALFSGHKREVRLDGATVSWSKYDVADSGLRWDWEYDIEFGQARGEWVRKSGNPFNIYRSGPNGYWREQINGEWVYGNDNGGVDLNEVLFETEIAPLLTALDWNTPTVETRDDPFRWRLEATGVADSSATPGYFGTGELLDVTSGELIVDDRGIIHELNAEYVFRHLGGERTFASQIQTSNIGATNISRPEWVSTARDQIPTVEATITDDSQFIEFEIVDGTGLYPPSFIQVWEDYENKIIDIRLETAIEPGETIYLWSESTDARETPFGQMARGTPPSNATTITLDSQYNLVPRRWTTTYFDMGSVQIS